MEIGASLGRFGRIEEVARLGMLRWLALVGSTSEVILVDIRVGTTGSELTRTRAAERSEKVP